MRFYGRHYKLSLGSNGGTKIYETVNGEGLRLRFNVTHYPGGRLSMASIDLFNVNKQSEGIITSQFTDVSLQAGYENNTGVVFKGQIVNFNKLRDGPDTFLRMFCNSGVRALDNSRVEPKGLNKNVSVLEIIDLISKSLGLPLKIQREDFENLPLKSIGYPMGNSVRFELERLTRDYNLHWYIENGYLVIKKKDSKLPGSTIIIAEESGLIGTPVVTSVGISFKTHLNPSLSLNRIVNLRAKTPSIQFSGGYLVDQSRFIAHGSQRIIKINAVGDTHSDDWYSECDCVRYGAV